VCYRLFRAGLLAPASSQTNWGYGRPPLSIQTRQLFGILKVQASEVKKNTMLRQSEKVQMLKDKRSIIAIFCVNLYVNKKYIVYAVVVGLLLKAYVGSTIRPDRRWSKEHLPALRKNRHENKDLQQAFNDFGEEEFYYLTIESVNDIEKLPNREEFYIRELKKNDAAFNLAISGTPGMRGKKLSPETKRRQSEAKRGSNHPDNRKDFAFLSPEGKLFTPHGLNQFCKEHALRVSAMSKIANAKQRQHKGWQCAQ
jgi:group I intron endonuclease